MCAEESNGARHRVPDDACSGLRPKVQESCNTHECPKWHAGEWSGVSRLAISKMREWEKPKSQQRGIEILFMAEAKGAFNAKLNARKQHLLLKRSGSYGLKAISPFFFLPTPAEALHFIKARRNIFDV